MSSIESFVQLDLMIRDYIRQHEFLPEEAKDIAASLCSKHVKLMSEIVGSLELLHRRAVQKEDLVL